MKTLISTLFLAGSLAIGGCGEKKKYQDFANFIIKEGGLDSDGESHLSFSKENIKYRCNIYLKSRGFNKDRLLITLYGGNYSEHFQDVFLNGSLNYYRFEFNNEKLFEDFFWQSKKNEDKYNSLIDSIPKWYAEVKNKK